MYECGCSQCVWVCMCICVCLNVCVGGYEGVEGGMYVCGCSVCVCVGICVWMYLYKRMWGCWGGLVYICVRVCVFQKKIHIHLEATNTQQTKHMTQKCFIIVFVYNFNGIKIRICINVWWKGSFMHTKLYKGEWNKCVKQNSGISVFVFACFCVSEILLKRENAHPPDVFMKFTNMIAGSLAE